LEERKTMKGKIMDRPDIFNQDEHYWEVIALAEQLQAENAQLKAHIQAAGVRLRKSYH
jgi:hypothetical protein